MTSSHFTCFVQRNSGDLIKFYQDPPWIEAVIFLVSDEFQAVEIATWELNEFSRCPKVHTTYDPTTRTFANLPGYDDVIKNSSHWMERAIWRPREFSGLRAVNFPADVWCNFVNEAYPDKECEFEPGEEWCLATMINRNLSFVDVSSSLKEIAKGHEGKDDNIPFPCYGVGYGY